MVIAEDKSKWKMVTYGYDGTNLVPLKLNADGELVVNLEASAINIGDVDIASAPIIGSLADPAASVSADETNLTLSSLIALGKACKNLDIDAVAHLATLAGAVSAGKMSLGALIAGEAHIGEVGGRSFVVSGTVTRPADTPGVYHSLDEINTTTNPATAGLIEFPLMGRVNGGSGTILIALKRTNNVAANSQIRLHLYNSEPTAVCGDHTQFAKTWANKAKQIGIIDFPAPQIEGTGSDMVESQVPFINLPFKCASVTVGKEKSLFGRAEVRVAGSGAPTSAQVIEFVLRGFQD
jgi:hypothetical protein